MKKNNVRRQEMAANGFANDKQQTAADIFPADTPVDGRRRTADGSRTLSLTLKFATLIFALALPMNAVGQPISATATGLKHNSDDAREIWAAFNGIGTSVTAGNVTVTGDGTDGTPHSVAGIATDDSTGIFDLGTGLLTVSGKVDDGGTNTLYGFIYIHNNDFTGTINGADRDITIIDTGTSEAIGVYFRKAGGGRADIDTAGTIAFGDIDVLSNSTSAGASAFAAGNLLGGTITLGDLTATAEDGAYAYGAEFSGIASGTSVSVGEIRVISGDVGNGIAAGFIVDDHDGGNTSGNNAGTITTEGIYAESTGKEAVGVKVVGNNINTITVNGDIEATANIDTDGTAYGIQIGDITADTIGKNTDTITVNGDITATAKDTAFGIRVVNGDGGTINLGNNIIEVDGGADAYGIRSTGTITGGATIIATADTGWAVGVIYGRGNSSSAPTDKRATVNGHVTLGNITATSSTILGSAGGGAYGFSAGGVASGAGNSVTLGNVTAKAEGGATPDPSKPTAAAGVEFRGDVLGTLEIDSINVKAGQWAQGITVTNADGTANLGLDAASAAKIGNVNVTATDGLARGIFVEQGDAFLNLTGDVFVTAAGTGTISVDEGPSGNGPNNKGSAYGVVVNGNTYVTGAADITAYGSGYDGTPTGTISASGGAAGFAAYGNVTTVELGDIKAVGNWAVGVHVKGNVTGNITVDDIYVRSGQYEAHGIRVEGNLSGATSVGEIDVEATNTTDIVDSAVFGIRVHGDIGNLTLNDNITVAGGYGESSGIWSGGSANIKLGGDVTIDATGKDNSTKLLGDWVGAAIWTKGDTTIDLGVHTLDTTTGGVKVDSGDLTVSGGNSSVVADLGKTEVFDGIFTVGENTIVSVDAGSTFGTSTNVLGTLNTAGGTIDQLTGTGTVTSTGALTIAGTGTGTAFAGTINANANALALNGGTFSGNLTGTGATTVASGATLKPELPGIAIAGSLTMADDSVLHVGTNGVGASEKYNQVTVTGTATIDEITINLTKLLEGEYILVTSTGTMTDTLDNATVQVNGDDLHALVDGGGRYEHLDWTTIMDNNKLVLTINGSVGNVVDLKWNGGSSGIWAQGGTNWDDGAGITDFMDGDSVVFDDTTGANITVSGDRTVNDMDVLDGNWTFTGGKITGTGELTMDRDGTLIFANDAEFVGGAVVSDGVLQIGNGGTTGTFKGNITNDANVTFNRSDDITYSDVISGDGSVTKEGAGKLILTGNNTYTGVTTVSDGTLQIGNGGATGSVAGNIVNNANVTFNRSDDITYGGVISGTGSLTKQGAGKLILNGANTYTGLTTVSAGTLIVGGTSANSGAKLGGDVTVGILGTLGGHGTIGGNIDVYGTLSPGNSIGQLSTTGNITFESGSTYLYEIDTVGNHDLLTVGGTATIKSGAKLDIDFSGASLANDDAFQVIEVSDKADIIGTFMAGNYLSFFELELRDAVGSDTAGLYAVYQFKAPNFGNLDAFISQNARNVGEGITRMSPKDALKIPDIVSALKALELQNNPRALAAALGQLHGEVYATSKEAAARQQRQFVNLLPNGREYFSAPKVWNIWGNLTGNWQGRQKIERYSGYDLGSVGIAVGVDRTITQKVLFGAALGYDYSDLNFKTIDSKAQVDAVRALLYGSWYNGTYYVDAYGGYTKNFYKTERNIDFRDGQGTAFRGVAKGSYDDNMGSFGLEVGRVWQAYGNMFTPSVGIHGIWVNSPDVTEKEGGQANLFVQGDEYTSVRVPFSVKMSRLFVTPYASLIPELRATYTAELVDDSARVWTSFDGVRNVRFAADSGKWGQHSGRLGAGLGVMVSNHVNFRMDYDHEIYNYMSVDSLSATLGVQW